MNGIKHASPLDALSFALFRAHNGLIAVGDRITAPYGLTSARWQVMGAMALSGQPLTVAQIARVMGLTRQAVQRIVNELEKQGMLALSDNPAHTRARLADLTSEGRAAYDAIVRHLAFNGNFGTGFCALQAVELVAGAVNIGLLGLNMRDGFRLRRR